MARKRDPARFAARQAEILERATDLYAERGFHQTGMAELCAALEMSPGTLYRYFPSKAAIIKGLVEADTRESTAQFEALNDSRHFAVDLAKLLLEVTASVSDPDYGRIALDIAAEGMRNEDVAETLREAYQRDLESLAAAVEAATTTGQIAPLLDAETLAELLLQWLAGAIAAPRPDDRRGVSEATVETLVTALCRPAKSDG